jgi:hypothetical protein
MNNNYSHCRTPGEIITGQETPAGDITITDAKEKRHENG